MRKKYFHKMLSCLTLCDPRDCSPPGSCYVQEIFQARILEWVAISFSRGFFPILVSNSDLHCRQILYRLSHQGSPIKCWPSKVYRQLMK